MKPKSFKEAATDQKWIEAMQLKIKALEENHTWDLIPLPSAKPVIGYKWIYKIKYKANEDVQRYKARLVAKKYSHLKGLAYHDKFSLIVKMITVKTVMVLQLLIKIVNYFT